MNLPTATVSFIIFYIFGYLLAKLNVHKPCSTCIQMYADVSALRNLAQYNHCLRIVKIG